MDNLREWLPETALAELRPSGRNFGRVQWLLRCSAAHVESHLEGIEWDRRRAAAAVGPAALPNTEAGCVAPSAEAWALCQLYLLVGSDNFFRSSPDAINLFFMVHAAFFLFPAGVECADWDGRHPRGGQLHVRRQGDRDRGR